MAYSIHDFAQEIANIIHRVDIYVLAVKKDISDSLSRIFNGTGTFTDYYDAGMALLINIVVAYMSMSISLWEAAASTFIGKARFFIASFIDSLPVQVIIATHNMLMSVWVDYQNIFIGINNASAGLSSSLGFGMEFLPLALYNIQNVYSSALTLAGYPPETGEVAFLEYWADFLTTWDNNFTKYARNPGLIMNDLQEWANLYALNISTSVSNETDRKIQDTNDLIQEKIDQIVALEESINKLIVDLPEENFSKVQDWYAPIHEDIIDFQDSYVTPALDYLNTVAGILQDHAENTDLTWKEFMNLLANWPDRLSGIYFDASDIGAWRRQLFERLISKAGDLTTDEIDQSIADRLLENIQPPTIEYTPIDESDLPPSIPVSIIEAKPPPYTQGSIIEQISGLLSSDDQNTIINTIKGDV